MYIKPWPNEIASRCKLKSWCTCNSVWPGLTCTCDYLWWTALIIRSRSNLPASQSNFFHRTVFHRIALLKMSFFATFVYLRGKLWVIHLAALLKSLSKFNLHPPATWSVWPGLNWRQTKHNCSPYMLLQTSTNSKLVKFRVLCLLFLEY